jgi:hypothetical protein
MNGLKIAIGFFLVVYFNSGILLSVSGRAVRMPEPKAVHDTIDQNQILYNGRIWRNMYYMVSGDQFLFSKDFLPGSITVKANTFKDIDLKYDIFKDEVLTPSETNGILQINRELVDSFSVMYMNRNYRFVRIQSDSTGKEGGYFNIIYQGKTALYRKFIKKIDKLSINGEGDKFYEFSKLYFSFDKKLYPVSGKGDLLKILKSDKELIWSYIRSKNIKITDSDPESFVPVIRYFESLSH